MNIAEPIASCLCATHGEQPLDLRGSGRCFLCAAAERVHQACERRRQAKLQRQHADAFRQLNLNDKE